MARNKTLVVTIALLAALLLLGQAAGAAIPPAYQDDIDNGIAWLVQPPQQDPGTGAVGSSMRVQQTSYAVKKMLDYAREKGDDPFQTDINADDYYEYHQELMKAIGFILSKVQVANPDQGSIWDAGDTQYPLGDTNPPAIIIETSAAILALTSTGTPDATGTLSDGTTATYHQVVEGAVDYLKLAQISDGDGGWTRFFQDPWIPTTCGGPCIIVDDWDCLKGPLSSDQWDTGIATVALFTAEKEFGIPMGSEVRAGLNTWVLGGIQNDDDTLPGFGGSYFLVQVSDEEGFIPDPPGILPTGYLLLEQRLASPAVDASRVQDAIAYIESQWGTGAIYTDYEALYSVMMGLDAWDVREIGGGMWFSALTEDLVLKKGSDPFWTVWYGEESQTILPTEYALLLLEGWDTGAAMAMVAEATPAVIGSGEETTCTVTITNTGQTSIFGLALAGNPGAFSLPPAPLAGDDGDGILEPGETWTYAASAAIPGTLTEHFVATAEDLRGQPLSATDEVTVTVTVGEENQAPVASDDAYTTAEDTPLTVSAPGILANDVDADGDSLTAVLVSGPGKGDVTLNPDGSFTYVPYANSNGEESFTYMANDGTADSGVATASITVTPVNDPPDVEPEPVCLWPPNHQFEDVAIDITDPDNDPLIITILAVTVDEPTALVTGAGGKNKAPDADAIIGEDLVRLLRSERSGNGNGRVYSITFTATDGIAPEATGSLDVCVPHDMNAGCTCVDDGQIYDATRYS